MAKPTSTAPTKSKFFRVAVEGATTDGRVIDRAFIEQMAANFDPQVYGARIWVEHLRSTWADGAFKAYGDVTAVKAEEVELGGVKKLALYAQISPTPELVAMNKARQKIYTSIEINPKFSDTGEAYLVGLAVTDSPASLGTEVLSFATKNPGNLFSAAEETTLEFEDTPTEPEGNKLSDAVKNLLKRFTNKTSSDDARISELVGAVETLATHANLSADEFAEEKTRVDTLEAALKKTNEEFAAFRQKVESTDANPKSRPAATGGDGMAETDF
ncbi:capsid scaffolding serine peptidase GPO [Collimonas sp. PA-H2]|uniref:GPO family capsid scaffolding protein n=1 Tax=Collimonas sp. PA-H2 TaxID=1881062 RepID=UPI000BFA289B|nr:GPO family capsid scaffolding protein [Collimonas sp. PA-H2]PFH10875.1 capsid scaffolding serine peptidase GPO [Collimonas sp. PA-H2]